MGKHVYTKEERRAQFIKTGIAIAKVKGVDGVAVSAVAAKHKVTPPLIFHIFGDRAKFRATLVAEAKKQGIELKGASTVATPKRKLTAAQVNAIKRKEAKPTRTAAKPKPAPRGKKPTPAAKPTAPGKFAALPVPTGETVNTNLSPKV